MRKDLDVYIKFYIQTFLRTLLLFVFQKITTTKILHDNIYDTSLDHTLLKEKSEEKQLNFVFQKISAATSGTKGTNPLPPNTGLINLSSNFLQK